jgi:hypothetical protein
MFTNPKDKNKEERTRMVPGGLLEGEHIHI